MDDLLSAALSESGLDEYVDESTEPSTPDSHQKNIQPAQQPSTSALPRQVQIQLPRFSLRSAANHPPPPVLQPQCHRMPVHQSLANPRKVQFRAPQFAQHTLQTRPGHPQQNIVQQGPRQLLRNPQQHFVQQGPRQLSRNPQQQPSHRYIYLQGSQGSQRPPVQLPINQQMHPRVVHRVPATGRLVQMRHHEQPQQLHGQRILRRQSANNVVFLSQHEMIAQQQRLPARTSPDLPQRSSAYSAKPSTSSTSIPRFQQPPLPPVHEPEPAANTANDEDETEQIQVDTYIDYHPPKLRSGLSHPDCVVETVSLRLISALQLEAALYACQAHEKRLPTGERIGYLIGDGAGVGKGRTIATIIYENYVLGRKRAIWLSVSSDLKFDSERDLRDIGAGFIPVYSLNKLKYAKINGEENGFIKKGVIFSTYSSLIGECRSTKDSAFSSRLKQLVQWCGKDFDGAIIFDECHRAKNLCPTTSSKSTKTGRFVLELQRDLPSARIVYASATGATEPRNMAYMTRLGLWGTGQTFETFTDFIHAVENRGVGAMEMVAMDMKLRGLYLARQLSFKGAGFRVDEVMLSSDFVQIYDESVKLWMECRRQFARALSHMPDESSKNGHKVWAQFWSAHQRFFKYLCISAKVETCVKIALEAIGQGKCVVIGLQSTGESQMLDFLEDNGEVTEFVSTAKAVLQGLVEKHFPSYHDGVSAVDDFERMFLSLDGGGRNKAAKKRKQQFDDSSSKRPRQRHSSVDSDDLETERESEGESEAEPIDEADSEDSDSGDKVVDGIDRNGSEKQNGSDGKDILSTMLAEMSSDDEDVAPGEAKENSSSHFNNGEINPFCIDFAEEDPWAKSQQVLDEKSFLAPNCRKLPAILEQKLAEAKAEAKKIKKAKRRAKIAAASPVEAREQISQTSATDFISSTNIIGNEADDDGSINLTEIKTDLLAAIERLGKILPANTLDQLINHLGGPTYVAEMTGRRGRVITREDTGEVQYELRNTNSDAPVECMNLEEKEKFMNGEKLVAIISEAASSGISLQSDRRANNRRRRVHITLELPWSADKAIQQFGRTHRSNQVSAPEYLFLISELAGEKRFASIVAKRLESLGALTHGDRRATESRDFSQFNIDNKYGREALEILLKIIVGAMPPLIPAPIGYTAGDFFADMQTYLEGVGMLSKVANNGYTIERETSSIPKFLNRLLGLPVHAQNTLFQYFSDIVAELIKQAKLDGTYDMGIMDIGVGSDRVSKTETRKFEGSMNANDFHVEMHKISLHRGVSWEEALSLLEIHQGPSDGFYVSSIGFKKKTSVALIYGIGKPLEGERHRQFGVTRPTQEEVLDLKEQYQQMDQMCHHKYYHGKCNNEQTGKFCEVGRRTRTYFVLSGSVICVWPALEEILADHKAKSLDCWCFLSMLEAASSLRVLQIVPGFTNSHVLFNYRLSDTLTKLGHEVILWTQMEMSMVFTGDFSIPSQVTELRIPIHFADSLKTEGLKVGHIKFVCSVKSC
uniref:Strawberry notch n=1 Tax=Ditylenchus dipsaci TaxID=166011 RepID=A0A915DG43_9BILA